MYSYWERLSYLAGLVAATCCPALAVPIPLFHTTEQMESAPSSPSSFSVVFSFDNLIFDWGLATQHTPARDTSPAPEPSVPQNGRPLKLSTPSMYPFTLPYLTPPPSILLTGSLTTTPALSRTALWIPPLSSSTPYVEPIHHTSTPRINSDTFAEQNVAETLATLGITIGAFLLICLCTFGIVFISSRRQIWKYVTPRPSLSTISAFQGREMRHPEPLSTPSGFQIPPPTLLGAEKLTQPPPCGISVSRLNEARQASDNVGPLNFSRCLRPQEVGSHHPFDESRYESLRWINIVRETPSSRFSVTSSDFGDDRCVGNRRNTTSNASLGSRHRSLSTRRMWAMSKDLVRKHRRDRFSAIVGYQSRERMSKLARRQTTS